MRVETAKKLACSGGKHSAAHGQYAMQEAFRAVFSHVEWID